MEQQVNRGQEYYFIILMVRLEPKTSFSVRFLALTGMVRLSQYVWFECFQSQFAFGLPC